MLPLEGRPSRRSKGSILDPKFGLEARKAISIVGYVARYQSFGRWALGSRYVLGVFRVGVRHTSAGLN